MEADAPAPKIQETQRQHAGHKICGAISSQNRWVVLYSWCYYWKVRCHTTRLVTTGVLSLSLVQRPTERCDRGAAVPLDEQSIPL